MTLEILTESEKQAKAALVEASKETAVEPKPEKAEAAKPAGTPQEEEKELEAKPHKKGGFVRKIERLEVTVEALQKQNQELLDRLADKSAGAAKQTAVSEDAEPSLEGFKTYEDYVKALTAWTVRQENKKLIETAQTEDFQARQQELAAEYRSRVAEFIKTHPDFDEVLAENADMATYQGVNDAIMELENGPEVAYHLAQNPELGEKLLEMSPQRAIVEIGKISASLTKPSPGTKPKSHAPEPITPVGGGSVTEKGDPGKMTVAQYRKWREEQRAT